MVRPAASGRLPAQRTTDWGAAEAGIKRLQRVRLALRQGRRGRTRAGAGRRRPRKSRRPGGGHGSSLLGLRRGGCIQRESDGISGHAKLLWAVSGPGMGRRWLSRAQEQLVTAERLKCSGAGRRLRGAFGAGAGMRRAVGGFHGRIERLGHIGQALGLKAAALGDDAVVEGQR